MREFARLLDALSFMPSRNGKLRLLSSYLAEMRVPEDRLDRGWAMAALTGDLALKGAKSGLIRTLVAERTDPALFGWSYDFVGDLAETVALIWPDVDKAPAAAPRLHQVIAALETTEKAALPTLIAGWLDGLDAVGRWALLKLITGGLRVGVSARLAKTGLALAFDRPVDEIEELWHAHRPPYGPVFAWLTGERDRPDVSATAAFRPMMLANPLDEDDDLGRLDPADYLAEWKWDGIRVQLARRGGETRLYSRTGDDIGAAFPEIIAGIEDDAILDGELLVGARDGADWSVAAFNALQKRLNRKQVGAKLLREAPAFVRLYDILHDGGDDLRPRPLVERRARLEDWLARRERDWCDLSGLIPFAAWPELAALRSGARARGIEGLMLKRRDAPYLAGRPKGPWFKWKRDALTIDTVLMYAQRGHGKRSSFYSDYTFGCWKPGDDGGTELVPVGKAYFGFTDAELKQLDKWVRDHTTNRFGPVREVEPGLVLEVAFDSVHQSTRHKSGLAMRFPRVHRIRWDKPIEEADRVESLAALML